MRAARRGLANMAIQSYLTAAVINLKRLAKAAMDLPARYRHPYTQILRPRGHNPRDSYPALVSAA